MVNLEDIMLSDISQIQEENTVRLHLYESSKVVKLIERENKMVVARDNKEEKRRCYLMD